jgi:sugar phosphate isomerase/epimerase
VYDPLAVTRHQVALSPTTLPDTPPLEYVEAAAAAGYDAIGLRLARSPLFPFHPVTGNAALSRELKRALDASGLGVLDILSFYLQSSTDVDSFAASLELGADLGARFALVAGDDADWARLRDNLARFCDLAGRFGMAAAVEFAVIRPLATLSQTLRLLAEVGCENAVVCLDPLNLIRSGGSAADLKAVDARLLPYAQISDGVLGPGEPDLTKLGRMTPNQRRLPGEGTLPLHQILDALPSGLPLSVELPMPATARVPAREWAKTTAESTRRFLDEHYRAKQEAP